MRIGDKSGGGGGADVGDNDTRLLARSLACRLLARWLAHSIVRSLTRSGR